MIRKQQGGARVVLWILFALFLLFPESKAQQLAVRNFVVELTAEIEREPTEIALKWNGDPYARGYTINRKGRQENAWTKVGNAAGHETWFVDRSVQSGVGYEYQLVKEGTLDFTGYGYIYAGIDLPAVENRGAVILLVESSIAGRLSRELKRLEWDLAGDGWRVLRRDVSMSAPVLEVKELVKSLHASDPNTVRALFLFGRIPVPYSGDLTPDQHDDHQGAWPADVFYGDLDGAWTDKDVHSVGAEKTWNHNLPGDGKFDQSEIPSKMELQVGRVDLSRMTCFLNKTPSRTELDLLRLYLEKDHAFRHGRLPTEARALIFDRIGMSKPEPLAAMAWRNFAPFVGSNIETVGWGEYMSAVSSKTYLWTSVVAGGGFTQSDGVASSDGFALYNVNAVFTMFSGSYYGDWDNESNFLRAALGANGRLLVSVYSAQPQWICHTMALGETIGAAAQLTQENGEDGLYLPHNRGAGQVHVSLHGDPTLRAHPVASPGKVRAEELPGGLNLIWEPSAQAGIAGYLVYAAEDESGPYLRITENPVKETSFFVSGGNLERTYMVKAVTVTASPSGTYWNTSQGAFFPDPLSAAAGVPQAPKDLGISGLRAGTVMLRWLSGSSDSWSFEVERRDPGLETFVKIATLPREQVDYADSATGGDGSYAYRVRALNPTGASEYSNVVIANLRPAKAEFIGEDRTTLGAWMGRYGSFAYYIPGIAEEFPPGMNVVSSNVFTFVTRLYDDARALQVPGRTLGSLNTWNHVYPFAMHVTFEDDAVHQFAFYVMSYTGMDPTFDVEVYDALTHDLLDRRTVKDVNNGLYLVYELSRNVIIRIIPPGIYGQVEVYGLFVDEPTVHPAVIEPKGGTFTGKTLVRMSTLSSRAEIRYTLDGSEPRADSPRYGEPFWLYADAQIRARTFREGYPPSEISEAVFRNSVENSFGLVGWNEEAQGNWTGKLGQDGYWVAGGGKELPGYAEVNGLGMAPWLWSDNPDAASAPFRDRSGSGGIAAAWFGDKIEIDLGVFDTRRRAVALYFLDWDQQGRVQRVEVLDGAGMVRDAYTVENFANGKHLILGLKGYVKLRVQRVAGPNALLNGIFFDAAPLEVNAGAPVPLSNARLAAGAMIFNVAGFPDQRFCLDRSENLHDWTCFMTNVIAADGFQLQVPVVNAERKRFLRGHIVP